MRRIGNATRMAILAILAIVPFDVKSDDKPKSAEAVDRVLAEWQAKASTIQSVEVRFRYKEHSPITSESTKGEGRAVLASPNLALLENSIFNANGQPEIQDRKIWNGRSILQFNMADRIVARYPIRKEWPTPPGPLCLPFFFRMTVEQAKRDYQWAVLREDQDRVVIEARRKPGPGLVATDQRSVILLDRKTFLPKMMMVSEGNGQRDQSVTTYEAIDIKINQFNDIEGLNAPCLDAWTLEEKDGWLVRLFLK